VSWLEAMKESVMGVRIRPRPSTVFGLLVLLSIAGFVASCGSRSLGGGGGASGASAGETGSGGAAGTTGAADMAGATGAAGSGTGRGGSTGSTGTGGTFGTPSCTGLVTALGEEPYRGAACGAADPQVCYRTCGPEKSGVKAETCTIAGAYTESTGCSFDPARIYSCYRIPSTVNTVCPAGVTPQAALPCDVPTCTVCNSTGGLDGGQYLDSAGAAKTGFCVCQAPNPSGARLWSCANNNGTWPCPGAPGCGAG